LVGYGSLPGKALSCNVKVLVLDRQSEKHNDHQETNFLPLMFVFPLIAKAQRQAVVIKHLWRNRALAQFALGD
jgi:hypothetical protein